MILPLAFIMGLIAVLWVIVAFCLILIILVQKGKGGGLSAAFGGAGASSLLGSKTGDFLTWVTIALVTIFLFFSVLLAKFWKPKASMAIDGQTVGNVEGTLPQGAQTPPAAPSLPKTGE